MENEQVTKDRKRTMDNSQLSTVNYPLPAGYKKTEIGDIPEEWKVVKIDNICNITTGSKNTQDRIDDGKYPFFVRSQTVERINSYAFDGEAVLTAGDGVGTGKIFHYINGKFNFHQRVYMMSHFDENIDGYFFYLYFSNHFYGRIMQMTAKSSVDSVRREMIANMKIPLPPLPEQKAIATVLSDTDSLIQAIEKKIAKKQRIKKGAMQKLLAPKEGWVTKRLGEVLKVIHGKDQKRIQNKNGKYPILGTGGLMGYTNNYLYDKPSVLIGRKGTIDKPRYMDTPFWTVDTLFYTEVFMGYFAKFIFYIFNLIDWYSYNEASGVPSLNAKTIEKIEIVIPKSLEEQTRIAQILSDMDAEIEALQKKWAKYKQLKQGLMQVLLTGKIRLV